MEIKLSIGLPVYNEINFIDETIKSLLSQTFNFYELIIIDNCSNDGTFEVLKKYSKKDTRIKLIKNNKNIGMISNYNKTFLKSSGNYFSWAGAHDLYHKDYFQTLISEFLNEKNIALVFSNVKTIDSLNKILNPKKNVGFELLQKNKLWRSLLMPLLTKGSGDMVSGVFKSSDLKKTTVFSKKVLTPDILLITQISNFGIIKRIKTPLRSRRYFRENEVSFNKWSEKYIHMKKRYIKNSGNLNFITKKFPTLVMFINIFKVLGLKKSIIFPYYIFIGTYSSLIFLFRHRASLVVDTLQFLKIK